MTTQNTSENPAMGFEIDALLKQFAEPYNQKLEELLVVEKSTQAEIDNCDEKWRRFNAAVEVSGGLARAKTNDIRDFIRQGDPDTKKPHKLRAERAGHLEDVEINKSLMKEAEISIESLKLRLNQIKGEIVGLKRDALNAAQTLLEEYLIKHMIEIRPIMLFIGVTAELADAEWSADYNVRPDIHTGRDFSAARLGAILKQVTSAHLPENINSRAFLREIPFSNRFKSYSPLEAKALAEKIAAMEAEL